MVFVKHRGKKSMPQLELFLFVSHLIILLCSLVCLWGLVSVVDYKYQYMLDTRDVSFKQFKAYLAFHYMKINGRKSRYNV